MKLCFKSDDLESGPKIKIRLSIHVYLFIFKLGILNFL